MKMLDFFAEKPATGGICVSVRGIAIRAFLHVCSEPRGIDRRFAALKKHA